MAPENSKYSFKDVLLSRHDENDTICVSAYKMVDGKFVVNEIFCKGVQAAADLIERSYERPEIGAIWTNIQRLKPGSTKRQAFKKNEKGEWVGTVDAYTNITIDIDRRGKTRPLLNKEGKPVLDKNGKPKMEKVNATDAEREVLRKVAEEINEFLSRQFGHGAFADTGNGFHLSWRCQPMTPEEGQKLYRDLLAALRFKFEKPDVNMEIDLSLADDTQVVTVWGTWNRKYPDEPDRPQRQSEALYLPQQQKPILPSDILVLVVQNPVPKDIQPQTFQAGRDSQKANSEWLEEYGVADLVDFFGDFIHYESDSYEKNGEVHHPIAPCPCHEGEELHDHTHPRDCEIIEFPDGGIGISCFSRDFGLKSVIKKLNELNGEKYKHLVYEEESVEALLKTFDAKMVDEDETILLATEGIDAPVPEPEPETNTEAEAEPVTKRKRLKIGKVSDLITWMFATIFRDPVKVLPKFLQLKSRLDPVFAVSPAPMGEALAVLLSYFEETRMLPDKNEYKNFITDSTSAKARSIRNNKFKDKVIAYIDGIEDDPSKEFTVVVTELGRAVERELQIRATRENFNELLIKESGPQDVALFRSAERKFRQKALIDSGEVLSGPIHEMTEDIKEEFRKDVVGVNDEHKFVLGIKSIDNNAHIGLDGERTIFWYGPLSNFKTTALMTAAVNAAMLGKNGLILVGEHQGLPMMKTLTLMLGHFVKDDPEIGSLPDRNAWEGLQRTATMEDWIRISRLLDKIHDREILPGILGVQNINAITQGEEDRLSAVTDFILSFHQEHPLDFIVIDPLDQVMPLSALGKENAWLEGKETLERIQALSRNFEGRSGKGLMILTSAQFVSKHQREIEKLQAQNASAGGQGDQVDDKILPLLAQPSQCQFFTTIGQTLDFGIGVAARAKGAREGYFVRGRARFQCTFETAQFKVDPVTNVLLESGVGTVRAAAAAAVGKSEPIMPDVIDDI